MKTRESSMPEAPLWESFFTPDAVLRALGLAPTHRAVADFGCGYGTFTIPAAKIISGAGGSGGAGGGGIVHALDIDPAMVAATIARANNDGYTNINAITRDFVAEGTGLPQGSVNYVMLFNILHAELPEVILREAQRILAPGGLLAIMHWNHDPATPRGPSLAIRPRPAECRQWALNIGFETVTTDPIALPPYHYGIIMRRAPD